MIKVTYRQHCGDDLMVVDAARVSFAKQSEWEWSDEEGATNYTFANGDGKICLKLSDRDTKLIRFLARENHKSPFNHTFITMHVKAPVFVARQLVKHEYMPWNEVSRRYVDTDIDLYQPQDWRARSADKKQGSGDSMDLSVYAETSYEEAWRATLRAYQHLLDAGVCPEQARMILPASLMTEWYWSGTLFAWAKMCGLRLKDDTQYETRLVAEQAEDIISGLFPVSWEALRMFEE